MKRPSKKYEEVPFEFALIIGLSTVLMLIVVGMMGYGVYELCREAFLNHSKPAIIAMALIGVTALTTVLVYSVPRILNRSTEVEKILYEDSNERQQQ